MDRNNDQDDRKGFKRSSSHISNDEDEDNGQEDCYKDNDRNNTCSTGTKKGRNYRTQDSASPPQSMASFLTDKHLRAARNAELIATDQQVFVDRAGLDQQDPRMLYQPVQLLDGRIVEEMRELEQLFGLDNNQHTHDDDCTDAQRNQGIDLARDTTTAAGAAEYNSNESLSSLEYNPLAIQPTPLQVQQHQSVVEGHWFSWDSPMLQRQTSSFSEVGAVQPNPRPYNKSASSSFGYELMEPSYTTPSSSSTIIYPRNTSNLMDPDSSASHTDNTPSKQPKHHPYVQVDPANLPYHQSSPLDTTTTAAKQQYQFHDHRAPNSVPSLDRLIWPHPTLQHTLMGPLPWPEETSSSYYHPPQPQQQSIMQQQHQQSIMQQQRIQQSPPPPAPRMQSLHSFPPPQYSISLGGGGGGVASVSSRMATKKQIPRLTTRSIVPTGTTLAPQTTFSATAIAESTTTTASGAAGIVGYVHPVAAVTDRSSMTQYQRIVRESLEYFTAMDDDVRTSVQGRRKPVLPNQLGIRCRYCSHLPVSSRARAAVYYPRSLLNLYQGGQNIASVHFQQCTEFPPDVLHCLQDEKNHRDRGFSKVGKPYWVETCRQVGVYEAGDALWYKLPDGGFGYLASEQIKNQNEGSPKI